VRHSGTGDQRKALQRAELSVHADNSRYVSHCKCGPVHQARCGDRSNTGCKHSTAGGGGLGTHTTQCRRVSCEPCQSEGCRTGKLATLPGEAVETASKQCVFGTAVSPPDCAFAAGAHRAGHPHELFPIHLRMATRCEGQVDAYMHACSMAKAGRRCRGAGWQQPCLAGKADPRLRPRMGLNPALTVHVPPTPRDSTRLPQLCIGPHPDQQSEDALPQRSSVQRRPSSSLALTREAGQHVATTITTAKKRPRSARHLQHQPHATPTAGARQTFG